MGGAAAGDRPEPGVWGVEADRGSLWCGPVEDLESGWREEDGRFVTK